VGVTLLTWPYFAVPQAEHEDKQEVKETRSAPGIIKPSYSMAHVAMHMTPVARAAALKQQGVGR